MNNAGNSNSALPPIGVTGASQSKYGNNRDNHGSQQVHQQKKRRKYRMAYQQDTRHRRGPGQQNAENVMKAYGVPKPIAQAESKSKYGQARGGYGR